MKSISDIMKPKKCLVQINGENYVLLLLNGNKFNHLVDAVKKKKELYKLLSKDSKSYEFMIYDKDFETWVHLDDDLQIEDLSKIQIRPKSTEKNNFLNFNKLLTSKTYTKTREDDEHSNESIVVSVNPNDLNNQSNSSMINSVSKEKDVNSLHSSLKMITNNLLNNNQNLIDNIVGNDLNTLNPNFINSNNLNTNLINNNLNSNLIDNNLNSNSINNNLNSNLINNNLNSNLISHNLNSNIMNNNLINNSLTNNSLMNNLEDDMSNQLSEDLMFDDRRANAVIEVEWSDDDLVILMESCKQFIQEFTYYNISVDLAYFEPNDDELWERISQIVQKHTTKSYNRPQCKTKFLKLRTTYINIIAYSAPEDTYFGNLKYFPALKQLVDGLKPSIDLLQLNGQLKSRHKERNKDKNVSSAHLALIQQVKAYSRQFAGEKNVSKGTVWNEISTNLNNQGFTTFTGKSCQGLFHRLRYTYLHLLKTITCEEEGRKWPYFSNFSDIDLSPFTSRRQENKRKPRKSKSESVKNDEDAADEEYDEEDEENFDDQMDQNQSHFDPNDDFTFENASSSKRIRSS